MTKKKRLRERKKPSARVRKEAPSKISKSSCIIAVRLRGGAGVATDVEATLNMLHLRRKYNAVLMYNKPDVLGMLKKTKDYITWGEADREVLSLLLSERSRPHGAGELTAKYLKERLQIPSIQRLVEMIEQAEVPLGTLYGAGIPPVFCLHPPKGGFKRSLKRPLTDGGELGYRGTEITSLISRMI